MKRLAASLVFAAVVLMPAVSVAKSQPKPTTRVIPCDTQCKHQQCVDKGLVHAKVVCGGAKPDNMTQCVRATRVNTSANACVRHLARTSVMQQRLVLPAIPHQSDGRGAVIAARTQSFVLALAPFLHGILKSG